MRFAFIEDGKIQNIIIADEITGERLGCIYLSDLPVGIGADYINDQFVIPNESKENENDPDFIYFDAPKLPMNEIEKPATIEDYLLDLDYRLSLVEIGI